MVYDVEEGLCASHAPPAEEGENRNEYVRSHMTSLR